MLRTSLVLTLLAFSSAAAVAQPALTPLSGTAQCNQCFFHLLPGSIEPSPHTRWTIHSDLPEILKSNGVLYATTPVLPPFLLNDDTPLSEDRRTQLNNGFQTINGSFEVFIFHISRPGDGSQPRRIVVYTKNKGTEPVTIKPKQAISTDGVIGTLHQKESDLGKRVLSEDWDRPYDSVTIEPGKGEVIAYSKIFSTTKNDDDNSANINCFGIVRADIDEQAMADLDVYIIAIPGTADRTTITRQAEAFLQVGATSGETYLDLNSDPSGCQLRRCVGVFDSFLWRSELMPISVDKLPESGVQFQMALPAVQSVDCPEARQTNDMRLYPPYVRPETMGNYKIEYYTSFLLKNEDARETRTFDLRFGKPDADIGLGWQVSTTGELASDEALAALPVRTGWAGPKQDGITRSFLEQDGGPITLRPGQSRVISMRYMILGNSSLPYQIHVVPVATP